MTRVFITHAQVVTAMGKGLDALWQGLVTGREGFSRVARFDASPYVSGMAGLIPGIAQTSEGKRDGESQEISLIMAPVLDLIIDMPSLDPSTLLITASTKGGIDLLPRLADRDASKETPGLPVSDLPGQVSRKMGLERPGFNISAACASSTIALARAAHLIRQGREKTVAVLAADMVSEFVFSGFSAIGAMAPGPARPFDRNRQGLTLGEGAALLVLESEATCIQNSHRPLAEIRGWGIAGDAAHLTAPDRKASGLKEAIARACKTADITPDDIRAVSTHGTGTLYNDAMELTALQAIFSSGRIKANSIKGSIGHSLGAAGAIEAALCARCLEEGLLPGTRGLETPEAGAEDLFSPESRPFETGPVLTMNSGFGGVNAALILTEAP